eukprot:CAMPEP_0180124548 /NCGR_PEP_ID=MMETSP0986-20121125/4710_1 /TAXON_ID=697907 /ORGANISM="non described non described, Strain CCMP2293" /LENGTH=94 /DNA_ID=CAMNT_0022063895 /DNA_START=193 /DNA_END=473 /DNA_ORIENTATION=+
MAGSAGTDGCDAVPPTGTLRSAKAPPEDKCPPPARAAWEEVARGAGSDSGLALVAASAAGAATDTAWWVSSHLAKAPSPIDRDPPRAACPPSPP